MTDSNLLALSCGPTGEVHVVEDGELERIGELRQPEGGFVWVDVVDPTPPQLDHLAREFMLHPLALEDLQKRRQRPKVDNYPDQHVIVAYDVAFTPRGGPGFELREVHLFAGPGYVLTVRWGQSDALDGVVARFRKRADAIGRSVGGLLYAILDAVVDNYFPLLDRLNEQIDELEEAIVAGRSGAQTLREVLAIKRELLDLRRVLAPMRDVANALLRRDVKLIDDEAVPYYQDLYDHLVRVLDQLDLDRDLVASALDANMSMTANTLNGVMKRLTAYTVVLMVPTLIAGIYGMNFHNMPELSWPFGYVSALAVMALLMIGIAAYFRARDWF
ncbi:MAG: magnesium/cobalt transporter CorA [Candidatus Limnocylindria bacterium]